MSGADITVLVLSAAGDRRAWAGSSSPPQGPTPPSFGDGVQRVEVTVRGGYSPDVIRVRQGVPLEIVFDRQESR